MLILAKRCAARLLLILFPHCIYFLHHIIYENFLPVIFPSPGLYPSRHFLDTCKSLALITDCRSCMAILLLAFVILHVELLMCNYQYSNILFTACILPTVGGFWSMGVHVFNDIRVTCTCRSFYLVSSSPLSHNYVHMNVKKCEIINDIIRVKSCAGTCTHTCVCCMIKWKLLARNMYIVHMYISWAIMDGHIYWQ